MTWGESGGREFAAAALAAYDLPDGVELQLLSLSENATYLVRAQEPLGVLRVYRPGYQTDAAKVSELLWLDELRSSGTVLTPGVIRTAAGERIHRVVVEGDARDVVLFEFIDGAELGTNDLSAFSAVGEASARMHLQVLGWEKPAGFERMVWGLEEIIGPTARWGNWRNGPGLDASGVALLEKADRKVIERLTQYPHKAETANLVHGDLRTANVIVSALDGDLWVIDFDDCGISWFLWDLCSTITFIEHTPEVEDIIDAWLKGYTSVRPLSGDDLRFLRDLVILRRLQVLGWLGTRADSGAAEELGTSYTTSTLEIAEAYLKDKFLPRFTPSH